MRGGVGSSGSDLRQTAEAGHSGICWLDAAVWAFAIGYGCPSTSAKDQYRHCINETMLNYCRDHQLALTRSRAYRNSDQAWIEQTNGAVMRENGGLWKTRGAWGCHHPGQTARGGAIICELLSTLFQAEVQGARRRQGHQEVSRSGDASRTSPGQRQGFCRWQAAPS